MQFKNCSLSFQMRLILFVLVCCLGLGHGEYYYAKVPRFLHTCRLTGGITEADMEKYDFGSYKMVTVEKGEKLYKPNRYRIAETKMTETCQAIKEKFGAEMRCFIYFNALLNWPYYDMSRIYQALMLLDKKNISPFKLNGDPTFPLSSSLDVFDFRSATVQDWFVSTISCAVKSNAEYVDGVFIDRAYVSSVADEEARAIKAGKKKKLYPKFFQAYTQRKNDAINRIARKDIDIIVNPSRFFFHETKDYQMQNLIQDVTYVHLEYFCIDYRSIFELNSIVRAGKHAQAHASGHERGCPVSEPEYCTEHLRRYLSAFLMGLEDHTANAGLGESMFSCHVYWAFDLDQRDEFLGFEEYYLNLGKPGDRVEPHTLATIPVLPHISNGDEFEAYRPFTNEDNGDLQAVAVFTKDLQTVCFVDDCQVNNDPKNGRRCLGNPSQCSDILSTMSGIAPTQSPTLGPTLNPSVSPTMSPSTNPTNSPSQNPTNSPSQNPTNSPSQNPTYSPSQNPTNSPSENPTNSPSKNPTNSPNENPTNSPTLNPTNIPTLVPTLSP